jgi:hypothetical protein
MDLLLYFFFDPIIFVAVFRPSSLDPSCRPGEDKRKT